MHLRDHPAMVQKSGHCSWPPTWTVRHGSEDEKPQGEVGTLEEVEMSHPLNNKLFLFMMYEGNHYAGILTFDDLTFCRTLYEILKLRRGFSMKQIGDLDLSQTY